MAILLSIIALLIALYAVGSKNNDIDALYESLDARDARIASLERLVMDYLETPLPRYNHPTASTFDD